MLLCIQYASFSPTLSLPPLPLRLLSVKPYASVCGRESQFGPEVFRSKVLVHSQCQNSRIIRLLGIPWGSLEFRPPDGFSAVRAVNIFRVRIVFPHHSS